jgi:hypothetical protein
VQQPGAPVGLPGAVGRPKVENLPALGAVGQGWAPLVPVVDHFPLAVLVYSGPYFTLAYGKVSGQQELQILIPFNLFAGPSGP